MEPIIYDDYNFLNTQEDTMEETKRETLCSRTL